MDQIAEFSHKIVPIISSTLEKGRQRFEQIKDDPIKDKTALAFACLGLSTLLYLTPSLLRGPDTSTSSHLPKLASLNELSSDPVPIQPSIIKKAFNLLEFGQEPERVKDTLRWKGMVEQIVKDPKFKIPEQKRQHMTYELLKIVFVESGGDPQASSGIAFGLVQLRDVTAKDAAEKIGLRNYDFKKSYDNLALGLVHLKGLYDRYGESVGFWAYHLGGGNMDNALRTYLIQDLKLPISEVENAFFDETESSKRVHDLVDKYNITSEKLLKSDAVKAKLKEIGAWGNTTWEYTERGKIAQVKLGSPDS